MLGLTQQQLAELIGITYQQAHKYEVGMNRVSAGRLYAIAQALQVGVEYFFEGLVHPRWTSCASGCWFASAGDASTHLCPRAERG